MTTDLGGKVSASSPSDNLVPSKGTGCTTLGLSNVLCAFNSFADRIRPVTDVEDKAFISPTTETD